MSYSEDYSEIPKKTKGFNIELKRIVYRVVQYWYLVLSCLVIAFSIAVLKIRYAVPIYQVTASLVMKEQEESSEGRILYNNPLVSGFRNYLNETYIIRSYPIIQRTLESINFGVAFFQEGNIITTEAYNIPVDARVVKDYGNTETRFYFSIVDGEHYAVSLSTEGELKKELYTFGDTISFGGISVSFSRKVGQESKSYYGKTYLFSYTAPYLLTSSYVSKLKASWAEEGSGVLNLIIDGTNPDKEMDFLRGLIKQYQYYDLQKKNQAATRTIDFITENLTGISDSLHTVERQLERFKDKNVLNGLSSEAERLYGKLEPLEAQRVELTLRKNYYKYLTDYLAANENLDLIILPTSVGISDGILSQLISRLVEIQLQLKINNKPANPLVGDNRKMISEIKRDIIESIKNQQSTDKIKQDFLDKQIHEVDKQLNYLPLAERQLVSIQRNYSLLENLYIFLLQKRAEAAISKASTTDDILVVNPPMVSGVAISPKSSQTFLIAFAIGLGLPIVAFILMEVLNTKVQSKEDVEKVTQMPFVAGIGHMRAKNNLEVLTAPKSSIAESFRALRSNLNYFLGNREKAVILITSSISGEGKTFTSVNLASVLALSGRRTLIIGADMRRPKIWQDFNLSNDVGLSTYLSGMVEFETIFQQTSHPLLDLVSGGPVPPNPAELLLTKRMETFIEEARRRYDYIIIDTPPLAIVADAFALTQFVDHTLFLVRQDYTPKALLQTVNDFYTSGKLQKISIVLNDIKKTGPGYGYGYGDGYGYGYGLGYGSGNSKRNGYGYYSES